MVVGSGGVGRCGMSVGEWGCEVGMVVGSGSSRECVVGVVGSVWWKWCCGELVAL